MQERAGWGAANADPLADVRVYLQRLTAQVQQATRDITESLQGIPVVRWTYDEGAMHAYDQRENGQHPLEDTRRPPADPRLRGGSFRRRGR